MRATRMRHQFGIPDTGVPTGANALKPDRDPPAVIENPLLAFGTEGKTSTSGRQRQPPKKTAALFPSLTTLAREGPVSTLVARAGAAPRWMLPAVACVLTVVAGSLLWNRYGQARPAAVGTG